MTIEEIGLSDAVLDALAQCFSRKLHEVERYEPPSNILYRRDMKFLLKEIILLRGLGIHFSIKALDSFDNLFCCRCLVFDCRLHGCSLDLVFPAEKQLPGVVQMRKMYHVARIAINWS